MQRRTIPILILLMSISMVGIIAIQYRWINNAIAEKQELIDNNLYQAVTDVEQQLTDHRAINFLGDSLLHEIGVVDLMNLGGALPNMEISDEFADSTIKMEIQVMSSDDAHHWEGDDHTVTHQYERKIETDNDSLSYVFIQEELGHISSIINRIKLEVQEDGGDHRLDSAHVERLLAEEISTKGLGDLKTWGIWDNHKETFVVQPSENEQEYSIPLFTTDVLNPGRYDLRISLNKSNIIWKEIWPMILLSLVFILIISTVFAYSIKLVIKHKKISQIKSDFINNMTHEFKTPLASISLAADSLLHPNTEINQEVLQKYVAIIQAEKNKLNSHVERILEVAALNKDAVEIKLEQVNVGTILQKAINNFQLQIEQNMLSIDSESVDDMLVTANAFHLENVLVNLIDNSIKYSDDPAEVSIKVDRLNNSISVSDKGIGMNTRQLEKVFDNFYRAQSGDLHATKGFGLGLSYCKLVVDQMGGEISLDSKPDQGTSATIKFQPS